MNRHIVKRNLPTVLVIVLVSAVILFCFILGVMQARGPKEDGESGGDATISFPLIEPDGSAELIVPPNVTWEPSPVHDQYEMDEEILFLAAINQPIFSGLDAEAAAKIHSVLDEYCRAFVRISSDDKVLIVDDFMANGEAMRGLCDIVTGAGATLVGIGCAVEKGFQGGGDRLRAAGYNLKSLAIIESAEPGNIVFRED